MSSSDTDFMPLDEAPTDMNTTPAGPASDINIQALVELAALRGQLDSVLTLMQHNHQDIHRRIDDMRVSVDHRFDALDSRFGRLDERVNTVEGNERSTALRTAVYGGGAAALVTAAIEAMKHLRP
jgi:hypothetical protein